MTRGESVDTDWANTGLTTAPWSWYNTLYDDIGPFGILGVSQARLAVVLVASSSLRLVGGEAGVLGLVLSVMGELVPPAKL